MRIVFISLILLTMVGCASVSPIKRIDQTERKLVAYPKVEEIITRGLGESLVAKGVRTTGDAIEILEATQFNKEEGESCLMTCALTVLPGSFFKSGVYESKLREAHCYGPVNFQFTLTDGSTNWNCPGKMGVGDICKDSSGKYFFAVGDFEFELKQDFDHIRQMKRVIERQENFIQEMIYNGRVGDYLKFIYREFSDNLARPAFTQEVQYDLSKSSVVGFKNLRLEIIQATNTEITYRLINNF